MTIDEQIVSISINDSSISAAVFNPKKKQKIVAKESVASVGIKNGFIQNAMTFSNSIMQLIRKLSNKCPDIKKVLLSIPGCSIKSFYISESFKIEREILNSDIEFFSMETMKKFNVSDIEILQYMPIQYFVDGVVVESPYGMMGSKLSVEMHVLAVDKNALDSIVYNLGRCGLEVSKVLPSAYLSGLSCIKEEDKAGVLVIDIDENSSTLSLFLDGKISYIKNTNIGASTITSDIMKKFSITQVTDAKVIEARYGSCIEDEEMDEIVSSAYGYPFTKRELHEIIMLGLAKIFDPIVIELEKIFGPIMEDMGEVEYMNNNPVKNFYLIGKLRHIRYIDEYASEEVLGMTFKPLKLEELQAEVKQEDIMMILPHYGYLKYCSKNKIDNTLVHEQKKKVSLVTKFINFLSGI